MNDLQSLILPWAAGVLLGGMFFGGLWLTVRKGLSSKHPALWFLASQLLRTSVTLAGFYYVAGGHWERLLACLVGFIGARFVVTRLTRLPGDNQTRSSSRQDFQPPENAKTVGEFRCDENTNSHFVGRIPSKEASDAS